MPRAYGGGQDGDFGDYTANGGGTQWSKLTQDQMTNRQPAGFNFGMSRGDESGTDNGNLMYTYDTPYGKVSEVWPGKYMTADKIQWNEGLAEPMIFSFDGPDGTLVGKPRDTGYSLGEQLGDFAASIGELAATGGALYGAAYGAGSLAGGGTAGGTAGAGATGSSTAAAGSAAAAEAELLAGAGIGAGGGATGAVGGATLAGGGTGVVGGGGTLAGSATGAAGAGSSFLDKLAGSGNYSDLAKLGLGAYESYNQGKTADENRDYLQGLTPNREWYEQQQRDAYEDPSSYFNSPEYTMGLSKVSNQLQLGDATRGRLANSTERQAKMQQWSLDSLRNYRNDLGNVTNSNRNTASGNASNWMNQNTAENNQYRPILDAIGNYYNPNNPNNKKVA